MVEKSYSDARPNEVSVEKVGKFTSVWLRKNIVEDTADQGPDGSESVAFWTWDEVFFSVPGNMTESEASERFDELWDEYGEEFDARSAIDELEKKIGSASVDPAVPALLSVVYPTMSASLTETQQVEFISFTPEWEPDTEYKQRQTVMRNGQLYRVSQDHTSQAVYPPETAGESLYYPITVADDGIIVYRECHGEYDMARKGERRHYPGATDPVYRALENTSYSPDVYPNHWKKVKE